MQAVTQEQAEQETNGQGCCAHTARLEVLAAPSHRTACMQAWRACHYLLLVQLMEADVHWKHARHENDQHAEDEERDVGTWLILPAFLSQRRNRAIVTTAPCSTQPY